MAKVPVPLRLDPQKLAKVDAYAKARGSSRQVVLESAIDSFLDDSTRGVPDLVEETPAPKVAPKFKAKPIQRQETREDWDMARQRALNSRRAS